MRILVDNKADKNRAYPLPWRNDANCFNFHCPDRQVYPDRLMEIKRPSYVETLVIACELEDYTFISRMKNLTQLYIYDGVKLEDLTFIKNLTKLRQLCICNSKISSLDSLKELIYTKERIYKELSTGATSMEEFRIRNLYAFEGICIQTEAYDSDGTELFNNNICRGDIIINRHVISYSERIRKRLEERLIEIKKKKMEE